MPAPLAVPQLGSGASSGRSWRLWAARRSQEEAAPLSPQPPPPVFELSAPEAAHFPAVDHSGAVGVVAPLYGGFLLSRLGVQAQPAIAAGHYALLLGLSAAVIARNARNARGVQHSKQKAA